jgi:hypothetical protein
VISRRALTFIHAFLALQLILPLSYYSCRRDRFDERFAWRMFSAERMATCRGSFLLGEAKTPVRLGSRFHEAWLTLVQRGRQQVVEAMAARLCHDNPGQAVRVELSCTTVDGKTERLSRGSWDLCRTHEL